MTGTRFESPMRVALDQARLAYRSGEIPIGAVVLDAHGEVIASAHNSREATQDPTAHAEVLALRAASRHLGRWRLDDCTLVVTLEPCPMCAGAAVMARVGTLAFGAWNDDYGASGSRWDLVRDPRLPHRVQVFSGVLADECGALVREFLEERRDHGGDGQA